MGPLQFVIFYMLGLLLPTWVIATLRPTMGLPVLLWRCTSMALYFHWPGRERRERERESGERERERERERREERERERGETEREEIEREREERHRETGISIREPATCIASVPKECAAISQYAKPTNLATVTHKDANRRPPHNSGLSERTCQEHG